MLQRNLTLLLALSLFLWLSVGLACDSGDDDDDSGDDDDTGADDDAATDDDAVNDDVADDDTADDDTAPVGWVWNPIEGSLCRDGSAAGFAVRLNPNSDKLVIALQGGGACYDADSCADNPSHFGEEDFNAWIGGSGVSGIFNDANDANPVKDWNFVFIPYCTGDLHAGSQPNGVAPGAEGAQQFVGYQNMALFLPEIQEAFSSVTGVFLTGESAGGFGVMLNYAQVANTFSGVPVALLDDSGPLFESDDVLAPCLQVLVTFLWNVQPAIDDGCSDCIQVNGDGYSGWYPWLAENYPLGTFGLFSSMEDATIRDFFGMGQDNCSGTTDIPADVYSAGLIDMRDNLLLPTEKWSTYYIPGDTHTITPDETMYFDTAIGDVAFTTWMGELLNSVPAPVGP